MGMRLFKLAAVFVLVVTLLALGCSKDQETHKEPAAASTKALTAQEQKPLIISETTILQQPDQGTEVVYTVSNPNKDYGLYKARIYVSLIDVSGNVLFSNEGNFPGYGLYTTQFLIPPGETHEYVYGVMGSGNATSASVQIDGEWRKFSVEDIPKVRVLSLNAEPAPYEGQKYIYEKVSGQVINDSEKKIDVGLGIVARENGKIVGAASDMIESVEPGVPTNFQTIELDTIGKFAGKELTYYFYPMEIPKLENN